MWLDATRMHSRMRETSTAVVHLNEQGVIVVRIRDRASQSAEDARANLEAAQAETAGRRRPLLVDIRTAQPLDAEARHIFTGPTLAESFTALALLVEISPLDRMMGNIYVRVARPPLPTQLFTDEPRALEWLNNHRQ